MQKVTFFDQNTIDIWFLQVFRYELKAILIQKTT